VTHSALVSLYVSFVVFSSFVFYYFILLFYIMYNLVIELLYAKDYRLVFEAPL